MKENTMVMQKVEEVKNIVESVAGQNKKLKITCFPELNNLATRKNK